MTLNKPQLGTCRWNEKPHAEVKDRLSDCEDWQPLSPPSTMFEVMQDKDYPQDWRVEAIVDDGDIFVAVFSGPTAKERAEEYCHFKNAQTK